MKAIFPNKRTQDQWSSHQKHGAWPSSCDSVGLGPDNDGLIISISFVHDGFMNMLLDALDGGFMKKTDGWLTAIFFMSLRHDLCISPCSKILHDDELRR